MLNDNEYIAIALEQIVDPASGEVIACNNQLLSRGDVERIINIEYARFDFRSIGKKGYYDHALYFCYNCDRESKDLLTGSDIFFGMSCPRCKYPRWILKED